MKENHSIIKEVWLIYFKKHTGKPRIPYDDAVEEASGYPSEEHIFIDDIDDYVEASKKLGWDGIHFRDYEFLVEELKLSKILSTDF